MSKLIRFSIEDKTKGRSDATVRDENIIFKYPCQSKTDCSPYHLVFSPGKYHIQLWGAQGGSHGNIPGGKGGYASGFLNIYRETNAYLYIGGSNNFSSDSITQKGGYNGGGDGFNNNTKFFGCGGGGATDLRLSNDNLYRRIIIAGGGGGCGNQIENTAGYGGGENGGNGYVELDAEEESRHCVIKGGSQLYGGVVYSSETPSFDNKTIAQYHVAHFGNGCSMYRDDGTGWSSGGGGGGYFGGACGCVFGGGGAGGSGFVYSDTYPQHSSMSISPKFKLNDPLLKNGNSSLGNNGNGRAIITIKSEFPDIYKITCHCNKYHNNMNYQVFIILFLSS